MIWIVCKMKELVKKLMKSNRLLKSTLHMLHHYWVPPAILMYEGIASGIG
jgi:hypothetical protein